MIQVKGPVDTFQSHGILTIINRPYMVIMNQWAYSIISDKQCEFVSVFIHVLFWGM